MRKEIEAVSKGVEDVVTSTSRIMEPMRATFFRRFPSIALLLVTFGAAATIFGIERIITETAWLNDRPFLIFALGVGILILTGRLSKKLGNDV